MFYRRKLWMISLFLVLFLFLGLGLVSWRMGKNTLRHEEDFFALQVGEVWEFRFFGLVYQMERWWANGQGGTDLIK